MLPKLFLLWIPAAKRPSTRRPAAGSGASATCWWRPVPASSSRTTTAGRLACSPWRWRTASWRPIWKVSIAHVYLEGTLFNSRILLCRSRTVSARRLSCECVKQRRRRQPSSFTSCRQLPSVFLFLVFLLWRWEIPRYLEKRRQMAENRDATKWLIVS